MYIYIGWHRWILINSIDNWNSFHLFLAVIRLHDYKKDAQCSETEAKRIFRFFRVPGTERFFNEKLSFALISFKLGCPSPSIPFYNIKTNLYISDNTLKKMLLKLFSTIFFLINFLNAF